MHRFVVKDTMRIDSTFAKSCSTVGIETANAADTWPDIFRFALSRFYPPVGICNKIAGHSHKIGSALQEKLFCYLRIVNGTDSFYRDMCLFFKFAGKIGVYSLSEILYGEGKAVTEGSRDLSGSTLYQINKIFHKQDRLDSFFDGITRIV